MHFYRKQFSVYAHARSLHMQLCNFINRISWFVIALLFTGNHSERANTIHYNKITRTHAFSKY